MFLGSIDEVVLYL